MVWGSGSGSDNAYSVCRNAHTHWQALGTGERHCLPCSAPSTRRSQNHPQLLMGWPVLRTGWSHQSQSCWSVFESCWQYTCPPCTSQFVGGVFPWQCSLGSVSLQLSALGCCSECHLCFPQWQGELQNTHYIWIDRSIIALCACVCRWVREEYAFIYTNIHCMYAYNIIMKYTHMLIQSCGIMYKLTGSGVDRHSGIL